MKLIIEARVEYTNSDLRREPIRLAVLDCRRDPTGTGLPEKSKARSGWFGTARVVKRSRE
jgi:hypothetical protein